MDAAVVSTESHRSGRHRSIYTKVRFATQDGRIVHTMMSNSAVESGATMVRIRYNPLDPKEAIEDSNSSPYILALTMLSGAAFFLWLAHAASLHDGQKHFM